MKKPKAISNYLLMGGPTLYGMARTRVAAKRLLSLRAPH